MKAHSDAIIAVAQSLVKYEIDAHDAVTTLVAYGFAKGYAQYVVAEVVNTHNVGYHFEFGIIFVNARPGLVG